MPWTEYNRYSWTTFLSPGDLRIIETFPILGFIQSISSSNLADRGFCVYVRSKRYPREVNGSTRLIFKCGKSQIIVKIKKYFENVDRVFEYIRTTEDARVDHIQDEIVVPASKPQGFFDSIINPQKPVIKPDLGLDTVFEKYTMNELLEYHNKKRYEDLREHVKPTPVIKLVREEIIDEKANIKKAS